MLARLIVSKLSRITNVRIGRLSNYHTCLVLCAPKQKGGKNSKQVEDDEIAVVELPNLKDMDHDMEKKIIYLTSELSKIRGGRASSEMLNHIVVEAYGDKLSITDTAQITLKTPTKLVVSTFDGGITSFVATAIRESGLGLTPVVEGSTINVTVPKPSKEVRESLVKIAAKVGEQVCNICIVQLLDLSSIAV